MEYEEELVGKKEIVHRNGVRFWHPENLRIFMISCCQSYRTAQGRCYDCPNNDGDFDDLVDEEEYS